MRSGCGVVRSASRLRESCSRAAKAAGSSWSRRMSSAASTRALALVMSCSAERRRLARRKRCSASARRQSLRLAPSTVSRRWLRRCWSPCRLPSRRRRSSSSSALGSWSRRSVSFFSRCCSDWAWPRASSTRLSCCWSRASRLRICHRLQPATATPAAPTSNARMARPPPRETGLAVGGMTGSEAGGCCSVFASSASLTYPSFASGGRGRMIFQRRQQSRGAGAPAVHNDLRARIAGQFGHARARYEQG